MNSVRMNETMHGLVCPFCHNEDHKPGAKFCWVCGYGFPRSVVRDETYVLEKAIETFGAEHQQLVAIEEMSELQKELCKQYRGFDNREHIAEEIADVEIVLNQLVMMFGCKSEVDEIRAGKVERLWERICEANGGGDTHETGDKVEEGHGGPGPEHPACEVGEHLPDGHAVLGSVEKGQRRGQKIARSRGQILVSRKGRWSENE